MQINIIKLVFFVIFIVYLNIIIYLQKLIELT
jgi:hypothetical protein